MDPAADHGVLNGLARQRVNTELIARNWDDMLRVAGSLARGTIGASELIGSLLRSNRPSTLTRAIGALGRVAKTLYLLSYIDDETYRRRILTQLNRGESRHGVARAIFHGQRGEVRQRYREGQEDQLGALGLVVNVWCSGTPCNGRGTRPGSSPRYRGQTRRRGSPLPLGAREHQLLGKIFIRVVGIRRPWRVGPLHNPEEAASQAGPTAA